MKKKKTITLSLLLNSLFLSICLFSCKQKTDINKSPYTADIIIYGGTSAAITAAVEAKNSGKSVIIVSPDIHLGGLSSGGLGFTDTGDKSVIGGLAREFYHRIWQHYTTEDAWPWQAKNEYGNKGQGTPAIDGENRTMWIFEPHVAEKVFNDLIKENKIRVDRNEWLNRKTGVEMKAGKIVSITTLSGNKYTGKMFLDATYEGDLMASAGVNYHVGREAAKQYGEEWNGVQTGVLHHQHWFDSDISPYRVPNDSTSGILPGITAQPSDEKHQGDEKIQAYCFRLCMTNKEENRVSLSKTNGV